MSRETNERRVGSPAAERRLLRFTFDGEPIDSLEGETIAVALLAAGRRTLRISQSLHEPRGLFCNMGVCFDCLVQVDGRPNQRACQIRVVEGMNVITQIGLGNWGNLS